MVNFVAYEKKNVGDMINFVTSENCFNLSVGDTVNFVSNENHEAVGGYGQLCHVCKSLITSH